VLLRSRILHWLCAAAIAASQKMLQVVAIVYWSWQWQTLLKICDGWSCL
jgi:hypothetical protein